MAQKLNAGTLNRRISVQTQSTDQDAYGQPLTTWTKAYSCWASISIQASQLLYSTAEFISKTTWRFTVRYTKSFVFAPNQRIQYLDQGNGVTSTYEIQTIVNEGQGNVFITLLAYLLEGEA